MAKKFGELEDEILSIFVQENRLYSVKEIQELLHSDNAYTTIMTVLCRLYEKGVLSRVKEGRSFFYRLKNPKQKITSSFFRNLKQKFKMTCPSELLSFFLDQSTNVSEEELKAIESMIEEYRRKRKDV